MDILEMFEYGKKLSIHLEEAHKNMLCMSERYLEASREVERLYTERQLLLKNLVKACTDAKDEMDAE